ncbi:MAG TPA: glycosyltransferase family 4 protein [Gaiellaceae bacterium]|nr:glycosyltransferase family 4 protein [Gaiellaceae bacterium]
MRICVVTTGTNAFGGVYRHTWDLIRGLGAAGHEVEVIWPTQDVPELEGVRFHGVEAPTDYTSRRWQAASTEAFLRLHREQPVDVVHGEGSGALGLVRAKVDRYAPVVVMFHGNYVGLVKAAVRRGRARPSTIPLEARRIWSLSRRHFARGNATLFRRCEAIVPAHQQVADTCRSHRLLRGHVHVVPNGVDARLWRPRAKESRDRPLLVASGGLYREKGFHVAVSALAEIDARLVIAGQGAQADPLRRLAAELGVADRFELTGALPPDQLAALVAQADVYLFPTLREEAAPLVLPEALACGVPVVASGLGGIPEVIDRPGENGILVRPGDPGELAAATNRLLGDDALRASMGAAARERVLEEYTLERMVERTVAVYEVALGRTGERVPVAAAA